MKTNTNEAEKSVENEKSGTQTGHTSPVSHFPADLARAEEKADRAAKSSVEYWKGAVTSRTIRGKPTAELYARFREGGRDCWVCLNTPNKATAATKARDLWLNVKAKGLDVAVAEFRPKSAPRAARAATVGNLIATAKTLASVRPSTLLVYEASLRRLVAGVLGMKAGGAVFYHKSAEAAAWRAKVDAATLDVLTPARVEAWRRGYIDSATDEKARISSKNTSSCIIRNARGFFSKEMVKLLGEKLRLPSPLPLVGISSGSSTRRFKTTVNPRDLYAAALVELTGDTLTAFLLCITAGLRKGEADLLGWENVDLDGALVHVTATKWFLPKTDESQRSTPIPPDVVTHLRACREKDTAAEFVLTGLDPSKKRHAKRYRCACWKPLSVWLRAKGFSSLNPIHELRKLSGSLVNSVAGLEAARRHLGHRNISTTAASYVTGSAALVNLAAPVAEGPKV
jgi:integrase